MRPVLLNDLTTAARALLWAPQAERKDLCQRILYKADIADRFTRRVQRRHPQWGNGTLVEAIENCPLAPEPPCSDPAYCSCLTMVLQGIAAKRAKD